MRDMAAELERRVHLRHRQGVSCEMFLAGRVHSVTVADVSRGGAFVQGEVALWPGALVRIRIGTEDRYAIVLRERHVPHHLRELVPRGFGLRWVRRAAVN
jgi:hypothetical protein